MHFAVVSLFWKSLAQIFSGTCCARVLWAISASSVELGKQSFNWTICSTLCLQQNRNHECAAQLWGRDIYSKSATKNRIRIRVSIRGRKPHTVRRTEARDQAECWEWARASGSESEVPICMWSLAEVLALGWGVALSLHLQHLGCWSNPCQNLALFSRFSWSVWHSQNDRRMFCFSGETSHYSIPPLIWNTPRQQIHRYFKGANYASRRRRHRTA